MLDNAVTRLMEPDTRLLVDHLCPVCLGNPALLLGPCPVCAGAGYLTLFADEDLPPAADLLICRTCNGVGSVQLRPCAACNGQKRHFVDYAESAYVRYRPVTDKQTKRKIAGHAQNCDQGYTWLLVACPVCVTGAPDCPVCLGMGWLPSEVDQAIYHFLHLLPPEMRDPRCERTARHLRENLDEIAHAVPLAALAQRSA